MIFFGIKYYFIRMLSCNKPCFFIFFNFTFSFVICSSVLFFLQLSALFKFCTLSWYISFYLPIRPSEMISIRPNLHQSLPLTCLPIPSPSFLSLFPACFILFSFISFFSWLTYLASFLLSFLPRLYSFNHRTLLPSYNVM